jgi:hypothetical protein
MSLGMNRTRFQKSKSDPDVPRHAHRNVVSIALCSMLCLVLNGEAAQNLRGPDKAVSPTRNKGIRQHW